MKILSILILLSILFASCITMKDASVSSKGQSLTEGNLDLLNGNYKIFSIDKSYRTLEEALFNDSEYNFANLPDSNVVLNLEFIDKNHLRIALQEGESIKKKKIVRGEIKDGYFEIKKSVRLYFRLIINGFGAQKTRIGILKNDNITVDTIKSGIVFLVVLPFGGTDSELYNLEFERIEN